MKYNTYARDLFQKIDSDRFFILVYVHPKNLCSFIEHEIIIKERGMGNVS